MSSKGRNIAFKIMPNGNIRGFQAGTNDKRGVSELQITDVGNGHLQLSVLHRQRLYSMTTIGARIMAIRGRSDGDWHKNQHYQKVEIGGDISNSITSVAKDNYIVEFYK